MRSAWLKESATNSADVILPSSSLDGAIVLNESDAPMAMIWVYAGSEPDRTIVNNSLCADVSASASLGKRLDIRLFFM